MYIAINMPLYTTQPVTDPWLNVDLLNIHNKAAHMQVQMLAKVMKYSICYTVKGAHSVNLYCTGSLVEKHCAK